MPTIDYASPSFRGGGAPPPLVIAGCAVAFVSVILFEAGAGAGQVFATLAIDGSLALLWLAAAAGIGGLVLLALRVPIQSRSLRLAVAASLGLGIISIV